MEFMIFLFFAFMTYYFINRDGQKSKIINEITVEIALKEDELKRLNSLLKELNGELCEIKDERRELKSRLEVK